MSGEIPMIDDIFLDDIIDLRKFLKVRVRWSLSCDNQNNIHFDSICHRRIVDVCGRTARLT
jgi:hypothetical protein